jgi:hypothetical protein
VIQFAVIANRVGKDIAIVVHDTNSGRVVVKGDSSLQKDIGFALDRPVVITQALGRAMFRQKLTSKEPTYLRALLDRSVYAPLKVRMLEEAIGSHRIDSLADKLETEYLLEKDK